MGHAGFNPIYAHAIIGVVVVAGAIFAADQVLNAERRKTERKARYAATRTAADWVAATDPAADLINDIDTLRKRLKHGLEFGPASVAQTPHPDRMIAELHDDFPDCVIDKIGRHGVRVRYIG